MSKLSYAGIVVVLMLGGSFLWNGCQTPRQTDAEYLRQYKVLNATNMSDAGILKERAEKDAETARWKESNGKLAEELDRQGIDYSTGKLQYHMNQMEFYELYHEHNVTAEDYVRVRFK